MKNIGVLNYVDYHHPDDSSHMTVAPFRDPAFSLISDGGTMRLGMINLQFFNIRKIFWVYIIFKCILKTDGF
jgi:hypothetical protein